MRTYSVIIFLSTISFLTHANLFKSCLFGLDRVLFGIPPSQFVKIEGRYALESITIDHRRILAHFNPSSPRITYDLKLAIYSALKKRDDSEVLESLEAIFKEYGEAIKRQQGLSGYLEEAARKGEIHWVGVDFPSGELIKDTAGLQVITEQLNSRFGRYPNWSEEKTQQLLHLLYDPPVIAIASYPDTFFNIRFISLIDEDTDMRYRRAASFRSDLASEVEEKIIGWPEVFRGLNVPGSIPRWKTRRILSRVRRTFPEEVVTLVNRYIQAHNQWVSLKERREREFARTILNQAATGVAFFLSSQQTSIQRELIRQSKEDHNAMIRFDI